MARGRAAGAGPVRRLVGVVGLTITLVACGADATDPAGGPSTDRETERITEHGVAAVVADHLGRRVARYGSFGQERDQVSLVVVLRGADRRDMFMVAVSAPGHPDEIPAEASCGELGRRFSACEDLAGGGVAAVASTPYGFSDDNVHGSVLMGWVTRPGRGSASAMFESYDRTSQLSEQDLLQLLADDRLDWQTSPGVNESGRTLRIQRMPG